MNNAFTPFLLLGITAGIFYMYIDPMYAEVSELRVQQDKYEDALVQAQEMQVLKEELLSKYNSFSPEDMNKLQKFLPDSVDNISLLLDIDGIAARNNLVVNNIKITRSTFDTMQVVPAESASQLKPYNSLKVSFKVQTTYDNFLKFLRDLEQSLRLIDVTNIAITPTSPGIYTFNVTISTYWLK